MPEQQQSGQDNSLDLLWTIALIIGGTLALWYFGKSYIIKIVLQINLYEVIGMQTILEYLSRIPQLKIYLASSYQSLSQWAVYLTQNTNTTLDFSTFASINTAIGSYTRYPLGALTILSAILLYLNGPGRRFRHIYTTKTLKQLESRVWPQITPVVNLDLVKQKIGEGAWAIASAPMEFCKKNNLLEIEKHEQGYKAQLRLEEAQKVLALQVGPKWQGVEALPLYLKALFAIFAARINEDKSRAEALLDQLSLSATDIDPNKMNFNGVDELLKKYGNTKKTLKITSQHGYVSTVFASLLVGAREIGVLASAEFIWLKPLDRRMWYMLNTVGRSTAVAEICGAFAHWLAEKKIGRPLAIPMVEEAAKGLAWAISDTIYQPDEEA